jgi:hypothetical protein
MLPLSRKQTKAVRRSTESGAFAMRYQFSRNRSTVRFSKALDAYFNPPINAFISRSTSVSFEMNTK